MILLAKYLLRYQLVFPNLLKHPCSMHFLGSKMAQRFKTKPMPNIFSNITDNPFAQRSSSMSFFSARDMQRVWNCEM
jgi:hypothetical protein